MTEPTPHQKYAFDTVFDGDGDIASAPVRPKRLFTAEETESIRVRAFIDGERSAVARAEEIAAAALAEIAAAAKGALSVLAAVAHEHRTGSADLALAAARKIAGAALDRFPEAPVQAALEGLAREVEAIPRLVIRCTPDLVERIQAALDQTAQAVGFPGQIVVKADPALPRAAFVLDWGDGRASYDPVEAAARVASALETALAAEGLHGEPLLPHEADHG